MSAFASEPLVKARPRCAYCGDLVGVYEPIVHVSHGLAEKTSRTAQPELLARSRGLMYHALCHRLMQRSAGR